MTIGRLSVRLNLWTWPPVYWGPFGAHGWTPVLWRLNVWPFHICWFYPEDSCRRLTVGAKVSDFDHPFSRVFVALFCLVFRIGRSKTEIRKGGNAMREHWPGRPTRVDVLRPRGLREQFAAWFGRSLLERWDHELGAETLRADAGWDEAVKAKQRRVVKDAPQS